MCSNVTSDTRNGDYCRPASGEAISEGTTVGVRVRAPSLISWLTPALDFQRSVLLCLIFTAAVSACSTRRKAELQETTWVLQFLLGFMGTFGLVLNNKVINFTLAPCLCPLLRQLVYACALKLQLTLMLLLVAFFFQFFFALTQPAAVQDWTFMI